MKFRLLIVFVAIAISANAQSFEGFIGLYGNEETGEVLPKAVEDRIAGAAHAVSNAAVLRSIATVPASAAYSAPAAESLPFVVTNTSVLTLSGLTSGSIGIRLTTTNASGISLYAAVVKDVEDETLATIYPSCDGTEQSVRWPWNASETLTVEAYGIPSSVEGAESAIITAAQVETWEDISLVGRTNDLADQHTYVGYPATTNEAANRAYADDAADAALALALGEIATATFNRDLAGYVQRWNPRFDTVAASNSLSTLYGGSTALRLDGEGAAIVPEIRAFAVESGEIATLTVWSYSGGATNLVPEVTTNLITGIWERKPESIVSATNIDAFTAQVVFTNDFERLLYVRMVDVSGGSGVPVFRVFGGIAFGDGEAITDWPQGTILGATINEPHTVVTNDGILAFTVTADGSGFPLTNDVSAAGFAIEGMDKVVANSLYTTNDVSARDLYVRRNLDVAGNGVVDGNLVVSGNLTLIGSATNLNWVVIDNRTNVYSGTNYIEKTVYSTQVLYSVTYAYTNIVTTNNINTYVNNNGTWNATNSEYVWLPHLSDYRDGNAEAIGTWDFSGANLVGLPTQGITNIGDGLTGDGLGTPLAVDWTDATTNAMTGISWESLGGLTQETDPIAIKPAQIGVGLLWTGTNLVATGEGTAIVTNEVDPRRYDAYREYATIDASTGTGTITSASALWLSLPASDEPRTLAMGSGFDAAQAWRFYVQIARGTNSLSIDTNLTGYAFLSLPVSSTNHLIIDRFPGDASFRVLQVYR